MACHEAYLSMDNLLFVANLQHFKFQNSQLFQVYTTLGGCGGPKRTEICIAVDFYFDVLALFLVEHLQAWGSSFQVYCVPPGHFLPYTIS